MRGTAVLFAVVLALWVQPLSRDLEPVDASPGLWANRLQCPEGPSGPLDAFAGRWQAADHATSLAIVCIEDRGARSWIGVIPAGPHEGVIVGLVPGGHQVAAGVWHASERPAQAQPVTVSLDIARALRVCWAGQPCTTLYWLGPANRQRLSQIAVIGHRAASLGHKALENSLAAVETAGLFGCTGIEIDVVIPYDHQGGQKVSVPAEARVTHPPEVRSEITGFDSLALDQVSSYPRLTDILQAVAETPLGLVYLDLKLKWLGTDTAALASVFKALEQQIRESDLPRNVVVLVGAEVSVPDAVTDVLRTQDERPWILELTRGTSLLRFWDLATQSSGAPDAISFNLLRISGGGGGILGWFIRDVSTEWERRFRGLPQPKIFWTANSEGQMKGALRAVRRIAVGPAGVLTSFPHRFIWQAASE